MSSVNKIAQIKKQIFIAKFPRFLFSNEKKTNARERGSSFVFVSSLQADAGASEDFCNFLSNIVVDEKNKKLHFAVERT